MPGDGDLVRGANTPEVYVIWGGARLWIPSPEEFNAMGYDWGKIMVISDRDVLSLPTVPTPGTLLRERSKPEVWRIHRDDSGGAGRIYTRRLHIPSPYALQALGHQWSQVRVVPNGCLTHIPSQSWRSASQTPGSTVFVPTSRYWHETQYYFPLRTARTQTFTVWGKEVRIIELRGWLVSLDSQPAYNDPDWSSKLVLDSGWAAKRGLDLSSIVKVGNILQLPGPQPGSHERAWIAEPRINVEVSGFRVTAKPGERWRLGAKDQPDDRPRPPDWSFHHPDDDGINRVVWPFNCLNPYGVPKAALSNGRYVRVVGSLLTDKGHIDSQPEDKKWLAKQWDDPLWNENSENHLARWTEVHPPDTIDVPAEIPQAGDDFAEPPPDRRETFRGVLVAAPPGESTVFDANIPAPSKPSDGKWALEVQELVGQPETYTDTIVEGNSTKTGARLTKRADSVRVFIKVQGKWLSGARFKALYRVFWTPAP